MQDDYRQFEKRKQDHIELALMPGNQASDFNIFDNLSLVHEALPDLDFSEISLTGSRFGMMVPKPFFVSSMTAGHRGALNINRHLIEACSQMQWAMGVGSQRRELTDSEAGLEWRELRRDFPKAVLFGNLGIAQLIETPISKILQLTDSLNAEALIIHCNPLQEVIQPEGTTQFKGGLHALANLVNQFPLPVIVKETGCGFSLSTLKRLNEIGVAAVDISGLGGTHWGRIEGHRAFEGTVQHRAAKTFANWGINTISSLKQAVSIHPSFAIWGSGGVRQGLDAAKLFALGAEAVGFAKPMLEAALHSAEAVCELMTTIEYELKVAMFCTGSALLRDLKGKLCD